MSVLSWLKKVLRRDAPDDAKLPAAAPSKDPLAVLERSLLALLETPRELVERLALAEHREQLATLSEEDPRAAVRVLRRFHDASPRALSIIEALIERYDALRENDAVKALWLKVLDLDPDRSALVCERIGALCEREEGLEEASLYYQRAVAFDARRPGPKEALQRLASRQQQPRVKRRALVVIAHEPPPGFAIEHPLGRGGFGTVYLARDVVLQRPVAIKFLHAHLARREAQRAAFFEEARLVASLGLPGVVRLYEADEARLLLIMEYMARGTLADRLRAGRPLRLLAALRCARSLCLTLAEVHGRGVVHRDIKPENVLFRAGGQPVLGDFGVAGLETDALIGQGVGTRRYAAPEVLEGAHAERSADLYGVGLLVGEMLSATPPPEDPTARPGWFDEAVSATGSGLKSLVMSVFKDLFLPAPRRAADAHAFAAQLEALIDALREDDPAFTEAVALWMESR